jgi:hypothetical protein
MSLSKSKCWCSNNCLHFSKRAVPLNHHSLYLSTLYLYTHTTNTHTTNTYIYIYNYQHLSLSIYLSIYLYKPFYSISPLFHKSTPFSFVFLVHCLLSLSLSFSLSLFLSLFLLCLFISLCLKFIIVSSKNCQKIILILPGSAQVVEQEVMTLSSRVRLQCKRRHKRFITSVHNVVL